MVCAGAVAAGFTAIIRAQLGSSTEDAFRKAEADVRRQLDNSASVLSEIAGQVALSRELVRMASTDATAAPALFDRLERALPPSSRATTGVTLYDSGRTPLAWAGRVFEFPVTHADDPTGVFVQVDPFGPRLVRVDALPDRERSAGVRPAIIVAEQRIGDARIVAGEPETFVLQTSVAPVTVRPRDQRVGESSTSTYTFVVRNTAGQSLLTAAVSQNDVEGTRHEWDQLRRQGVGGTLALMLLVAAAAVLEARRSGRSTRAIVLTSGLLAVLLAAARLVTWFATRRTDTADWLDPPFQLVCTGLFVLGLAWIGLDLLDRWRLSRRPLLHRREQALTLSTAAFLLAGGLTAVSVTFYADLIREIAARAVFDVRHYSLHPADIGRIGTAMGLVLLHAGAVWATASLTRLATVVCRRPRSWSLTAFAVASWMAGAVAGLAVAGRWLSTVALGWNLAVTATVGLAAIALGRPRATLRRASQATRLGAMYLALLLPAVGMHPLLDVFAEEGKEELIAREYGPAAASQRDHLKLSLAQTVGQIDARPLLGPVAEARADAAPDAQAAFDIWRATALSTERLTSAIELYDASGRLASRFAFRLPEAVPSEHQPSACTWDFLDEVSPFGSSERHVLRASRAICQRGRTMGTIVVRVMLDYRTLPFINTESPYLASLGPAGLQLSESAPGRDVEFVSYGWSRAPLVASGTSVWPLGDETFDRLVRTRQAFWETVVRQDARYRVYFLSDRGGIYALGYPVTSAFGHAINLAELIVLVFVTYLLLLAGGTIVRAIASGGLSGRALLREVRSSFYRKLVAAFVAGAAVPVFVLALATSTYFATESRAGVEAEALKTVTVAQRLVEDYAQIQGGTASTLDYLDDQTMVLVGRALDQPVNLYDRQRLRATSERDLYASALLSPRTSAAVFRAIALERMPAFVGEEVVNGTPYLVAAAPVRAGAREGIVTVPQTLRQRETEAQIDELNRRIVLAAVLFVLLGAALGYWMAERIADPVSRLTRATRRIARGDLDARIAATSSDELRRLVDDFNQMAADLKRQRTELERTQRLDAWADMARQVAHDIKNPLTPIQLAAEHARRVNQDRGAPLSPVLDECVGTILGQVRLLRQISAEFSSFASSPTPRPEPTDLARLVDEVVQPYRTTLDGHVAIGTTHETTVPLLALDRTLFARALTNIIENALHAMPGGGRLTISSRLQAAEPPADGQVAVVDVTDTGIGMDPEALAHIFEPYFSTKAAGTGLGLTIAKRNVELNGGAIAVRSTRGAGTTVTLTLPIPR